MTLVQSDHSILRVPEVLMQFVHADALSTMLVRTFKIRFKIFHLVDHQHVTPSTALLVLANQVARKRSYYLLEGDQAIWHYRVYAGVSRLRLDWTKTRKDQDWTRPRPVWTGDSVPPIHLPKMSPRSPKTVNIWLRNKLNCIMLSKTVNLAEY